MLFKKNDTPELPKSELRQEAEANIRAHARRAARIGRVCFAMTAASIGFGNHEESVPIMAASIPITGVAITSGVRARRACKREVDAFAVNVISDRDPLNPAEKVLKRTAKIREGELVEKTDYDFVAGIPEDDVNPFVRVPEAWSQSSALLTGLFTDVIVSQSYNPNYSDFMAQLAVTAGVSSAVSLGLSSATFREMAYYRQLDNIEGLQGIST